MVEKKKAQGAKKSVSKKLLKSKKSKALKPSEQQEQNAAKNDVNNPFYFQPDYVNSDFNLDLSGSELNLIRFALIHYFRANPEPMLWKNMKTLAILQGKIDDAVSVKKK